MACQEDGARQDTEEASVQSFALNAPYAHERLEQILLASHDFGRYIFVNLPAQQLWVVRPDSVFSMRICCGAWKTKTISHGCVRVQRPLDLALFLSPDTDEWLLDRIRLSMDLQPESDKGKEYLKQRAEEGDDSPIRLIQSTSVSPRVPVHLSYYTIYPNPEIGRLDTWPDRYEYDKQIVKSLRPFL